MAPTTLQEFKETLQTYYARHGRADLPWRLAAADGSFDGYKIMVSELMLEQTQVVRVIPKYQSFLGRFPTVERLAQAPLGDVLVAWSGLGYNRRAKFLQQAAVRLVAEFASTFPTTVPELVSLPGIGKNTAGAILAYAFNQPVLFVETNIRTVYIHHFFNDEIEVPDSAILELLDQTLDRENPREFYWALMDYGSHLKQTIGNASKFSKSYAKQSAFHGSRRQVRGQVLRALGEGQQSERQLAKTIKDERLSGVLADLVKEGLVQKRAGFFHL